MIFEETKPADTKDCFFRELDGKLFKLFRQNFEKKSSAWKNRVRKYELKIPKKNP